MPKKDRRKRAKPVNGFPFKTDQKSCTVSRRYVSGTDEAYGTIFLAGMPGPSPFSPSRSHFLSRTYASERKSEFGQRS